MIRISHPYTGPGDFNITPLYTGPGPGDKNITPLYTGPGDYNITPLYTGPGPSPGPGDYNITFICSKHKYASLVWFHTVLGLICPYIHGYNYYNIIVIIL